MIWYEKNNNRLPRWSLSTFLDGKMLIVGMMIPLLVDCLICLQICSNIASTVVIWRQSSIWRVLQTCLPGHLHTGRLCLQNFHFFLTTLLKLESVQDFFIKLDMKPYVHLVEISIFSLNHVIIRLTKIMNNLLKHLKIRTFKVIFLC